MRALSRALTVCAALPPASRLYRAARREVAEIYQAARDRLWSVGVAETKTVAAILQIDVRSAQRLLIAYGFRRPDPSKRNHADVRARRRLKNKRFSKKGR